MIDAQKGTLGPRRRNRAFNRRLEQRLGAYAAAAGAAGVGLLVAGQPARADVVVTTAQTFIQPNTVINLDLNNDGIADFRLGQTLGTFFSPAMRIVELETGNGVEGFTSYYDFVPHAVAGLLKTGANIGGYFRKTAILGEARCCFATYYYGPWAQGGNGFLGLRFTINGQIHYGWAELNVLNMYRTSDSYSEFLVSYAYDTVANQHIFAGEGLPRAEPPSDATPEPGTLALLALGSVGLGFWRRRMQKPEVRSQQSE